MVKPIQWKELKPTRKPNPNIRDFVVTLKVNADEMQRFLENSKLWTHGNVSEWLRYAGMNFKPKKKDMKL